MLVTAEIVEERMRVDNHPFLCYSVLDACYANGNVDLVSEVFTYVNRIGYAIRTIDIGPWLVEWPIVSR